MKTKPIRSSDKSSNTKKLFVPLFLAGILLLSTFAIIFSGPSQDTTSSYTYKDYTFRLTAQGWESTLQGQPLVLRHGPQALETLFTQFSFSSATSLLGLQKVYLSSLPPEPVQEALRELYLNSNILPPATLSCVADAPGCEELPLKSCSDATATTGVIIFRLGEQDSMTVDTTCITLIANTTASLTQMTDTMIYSLYGGFP